MLGGAGILAVLIGLEAAGWYSGEGMGKQLSFATQTVGIRALACGALRSELISMRAKERGMFMYTLTHDAKSANAERGEFRQHYQNAKASIPIIRPRLTTEEGKVMVDSIEADLELASTYFEQESTLAAAGNLAAAFVVFRRQSSPAGARMEKTANQFLDWQKKLMDDTNSAGIAKVSSAHWISLGCGAIGLGALGLIAFITR